MIKQRVKQKIPRLLCASSASREAAINDNSTYQKTHFLLPSFVLVLGSRSGEWSRAQPTTKQIAMGRKRKGAAHARHSCLCWYPGTHTTTPQTPFLIFKNKQTKNSLNFENFVLLKRRFWKQIDALLFHFHSQMSTETIPPCPGSVKPFSPPFSSFLRFQRELWRLWIQVPLVTFPASFPSAEATHRLCKKTGAFQDLKMDFFFSFFFF